MLCLTPVPAARECMIYMQGHGRIDRSKSWALPHQMVAMLPLAMLNPHAVNAVAAWGFNLAKGRSMSISLSQRESPRS